MATNIVLPTPSQAPALLSPSDHRLSLYVGDLHSAVTESDLYTLYSMIGPLQSLRLCRDRVSGKSLCYAYINFCFPFHAAEALARLNHAELMGKPMRIMWRQRDSLMRKTGFANLFVKNLDSSLSDARLEEVFAKFGTILSCKIAKDDHGKSKGFGFVQFQSQESANDALVALDGTTLNGKIISVAKFLKKSDRKEPEFTNVYFKNLDEDFTEILLKEKFSEYGNVTSAMILKDAEGKSRGFGFVNFESHESAKKAIESLNGSIIGSKKLCVGNAMKKAERDDIKENTNVSKLFVKNLDKSALERNLEELFGAFGRVISTKVIRYKNGVSKGFGYVCFSNPDDAKKARDALDGIFYLGKNIYVSTALSKDECSRKLNVNSQPNMYESVDVSPASKPQNHQVVKSCGLVLEMKRSELREVLGSFKWLNMQIEKAIRAKEEISWTDSH